MKKKSISWKITSTFALLTLITTLAFSVIFLNITVNSLKENLDQSLIQRASFINLLKYSESGYQSEAGEQPIIINFISNDGIELDKLPYSESDSDDAKFKKDLTFLSNDKIPLNSDILRFIKNKESSSFFDINFKNSNFRVYIEKSSENLGYLLLAKNNTEIIESTNEILSVLAFMVFLSLFISIILGYSLSKYTLRNLVILYKEIEKVNVEKPSEIILKKEVENELDTLLFSFNQFVKNLNNLRNREKELLEDLAHEVKTPLTSLILNSQLPLDKLTPIERDSALSRISFESNEINRLLDNVLLLVQNNEINFDKLNVDNLFGEIKKYWEDKEVEVTTYGDGELYTNKNLIVATINNLIENAVKFSNKKNVDIIFENVGNETVIIVRDYGKGVKEEDLVKIFERFYRPVDSRTFKGSGIGLSIVKEYVEILQGKVIAENLIDGFQIVIKLKN